MQHSDRNQEVLRIFHCISSYCHDALHQRFSFQDSLGNRDNGIHVVHNTSGVRRKHRRVDLSSGNRVDQHTLSTLRIFGLQRLDLNPGITFRTLFHFADTIRFVVLDTDTSFGFWENFQNHLKSCHQFFRLLQHTAVITGQIRFTLRTVYQYVINGFRILRRQFYVGREACSAHSDNTCLSDPFQDLLFRQAVQRRLLITYFLHLSVVLDNDTVRQVAARHTHFFNSLYGSRYGRMHRRRYKSARLCDHLSAADMVPLGNYRFCRCADVLGC